MDSKGNLREQALAAYHEDQRLAEEERVQRERQAAERDAAQVAEQFGQLFQRTVQIEPGQRLFESDSLTFGWSRQSAWVMNFHLIRFCEGCGEPIYSYPVTSLEGLGRMLDEFQTYNPHDHRPPRPRPETPEKPNDIDQLRDLLRRILGMDDAEEY